MPNLLPDWLPWIRPAGRLIWSVILLLVGVSFVFALLKPPRLKRPFPNWLAWALFPIIAIVGWIIAGIIPNGADISGWELDAIIVDLVLLAWYVHAMLLVLSRKPTPPDYKATWAACYLGAVGTFALMALAYAVVPHEWMTYANSYLRMGDTSHFFWQRGQLVNTSWLGQGIHVPPFNIDMPAVRDIMVTGIYIVMLGLNIYLFAAWQKRNVVVEKPADDATPVKRSRFGRPLRRGTGRGATAPAPGGA